MAEAMASTPATAQEAPTEALIPSPRPSPVKESAQIKRDGYFNPIPTEAPTPQKGVIPANESQTGCASCATPPIISANNLY